MFYKQFSVEDHVKVIFKGAKETLYHLLSLVSARNQIRVEFALVVHSVKFKAVIINQGSNCIFIYVVLSDRRTIHVYM